jgi:hypothetical protein
MMAEINKEHLWAQVEKGPQEEWTTGDQQTLSAMFTHSGVLLKALQFIGVKTLAYGTEALSVELASADAIPRIAEFKGKRQGALECIELLFDLAEDQTALTNGSNEDVA